MVTMAMASLLVEKDVLARLKANSAIVSLVPKAQILPSDSQTDPVWPFIVPQQPQGLPLNAACVRGATINFGLSAFTRGAATVTPRDHAAQIGDAIERCLARLKVAVPDLGTVRYTIGDVLMLKGGAEPGARHFSCSVRARVLA